MEPCSDLRQEGSSIERHVVQRLMTDVLGNGNLAPLTELVSPSYVGHFWDGDYYGPEGLRIDVISYRTAFPDLTVRLHDVFSCGERIVRRFTMRGTQVAPFLGKPATGRMVVLKGIGIDRVIDGQLQESWVLVEGVPAHYAVGP